MARSSGATSWTVFPWHNTDYNVGFCLVLHCYSNQIVTANTWTGHELVQNFTSEFSNVLFTNKMYTYHLIAHRHTIYQGLAVAGIAKCVWLEHVWLEKISTCKKAQSAAVRLYFSFLFGFKSLSSCCHRYGMMLEISVYFDSSGSSGQIRGGIMCT